MLTQDEMRRMQGIITSTSAALKRDSTNTALLLRRAALLVALGQPALARQDYERVLDLEPANPQAQKYVNLANFGTAFDPYEILGVSRDADSEVISLAFRRARLGSPCLWQLDVSPCMRQLLGTLRAEHASLLAGLAKQWHPDVWISASEAEQLEAETRFKQLNLAQGVLIDAAKRRQYDAGTSSVADLMIGWWEKLTARHAPRWGSKKRKARGAPALQRTASVLTPADSKAVDILTITLTGCGSGVGVGLDKANVVDMLVPGKPAARQLRIGDRVIEFDGQAMIERRGGRLEQRKLKDVVKRSDTHTVKVERARQPSLAALPAVGRK